jgi:hypothetical protein
LRPESTATGTKPIGAVITKKLLSIVLKKLLLVGSPIRITPSMLGMVGLASGLLLNLEQCGFMKKIIHVNQHVIRSNKKHGKNDPVITVKTYKSNDYVHEVEILGPSKVVYSPDKPLSCGAKVWISVDSGVEVRLIIKGAGCQQKNNEKEVRTVKTLV